MSAERIPRFDDDGFVANFWRAVSRDPEAVALHADWPVNETDLVARHSWLVRHGAELRQGSLFPVDTPADGV